MEAVQIADCPWPETTGNKKDIIGEHQCFLYCKPEQDVEKAVKLPMIWDTMMLLWSLTVPNCAWPLPIVTQNAIPRNAHKL